MKQGKPGRTGDAAKPPSASATEESVTLCQALQAAALSPAGDRPVDHADAAAVQAAEKSATGLDRVVRGGVAGMAQWAAETNVSLPAGPEAAAEKVTVRDVLGHASAVFPAGNEAATWVHAEKVAAATGVSSAGSGGEGGGMGEVADAVAAAAQMNEGSMM